MDPTKNMKISIDPLTELPWGQLHWQILEFIHSISFPVQYQHISNEVDLLFKFVQRLRLFVQHIQFISFIFCI